MANVQTALAACGSAVEELARAADACAGAWLVPKAPGKWTPAQMLEHVSRSLEEAARDMTGERSKLPNLPAPLRFAVRKLLFERVLSRGAFPRARTNAAMNPASGPATPADGAIRLHASWVVFAEACRLTASRTGRASSRVFGSVALEDYIRFQELHTRHHRAQLVRQ